ncbi:LCP family protein [Haloactinopolyspora alba]|nr:LCP family protein [Haloactinopolyspora alba]
MTRPDGPDAPPPPPGEDEHGVQVRRTTYRSGHVPGVSYRGGQAHSPREDDTPVPPAQDAAAASPRGTSVMPSDDGTDAGAGAPPAEPPPRRRGGDEPPKKPKRRRSGFVRFLRWLLIILLVIVIALLVLAWYVWGRIDKVDAIPDDHGDARSDGQVILLVGSDSREELSEGEQSELGTGDASGQRTDTIMLLHVPGDGARPALISVPRDSLVDIPDEGENRVNAAFAFGGAPLLVETLEQNTGVAIDDYVQIGFGGFAEIVDALGGVEMCLDEPVQDEKAHIDLPAGCQQLEGAQALGYARARHFDGGSDLGRVERQRELISSISDKALSAGTLLNPLELARTSLAGGDALVLDEDTGPFDMLNFVRAIGAVSSGSGDTLTVPLGRVGNTVDWDEEQAGRLWTALRDGTDIPQELLEEE